MGIIEPDARPTKKTADVKKKSVGRRVGACVHECVRACVLACLRAWACERVYVFERTVKAC